jgi:hypothetical protein
MSRPPHSRPATRIRSAFRRRATAVWLATSLTPLLLYFLARPYVESDTMALAISAVAPAVATIVVAVWRRRVRALSVLILVGLGVALAATAMTGGSSLPLKLYRPLFTGMVGLGLLLSALLRRPLLVPIVRALAPDLRITMPTRRTATVVTAIIGVAFLVEAAATVVLALTVSTGVFLVAARLVRIGIFGAGVAMAAWYVRRRGQRRAAQPAESTGAAGSAPDVDRSAAADPRAWFGPRRFGVGWGRPQTWQARIIVAVILTLIVVARVVFHLPRH